MKITNIYIAFQNKVVFENTDFGANNGELTVVRGESGSGKSTLLSVLSLEKKTCYQKYTYNNNDVDTNFMINHVGIVKQKFCLLDDLTIQEHISLYKKLFKLNDIYSVISSFKLEPLLKKYPQELSGGEQTRVMIMLELLKEPQILLLDEPTSSLDEEMSMIVIETIKEYAHKGHIVIATTHDPLLFNEADVLYTIEDKKLLKENINNHQLTSHLIEHHFCLNNLFSYFLRMFKHEKIYKILGLTTEIIAIIAITLSTGMNADLVTGNIKQLNNLSSTELIVYKPQAGFPEREFTSLGWEDPFTEEEYNFMVNIPYIEDIQWRFDCGLNDCLSLLTDPSDYNQDKYFSDKVTSFILVDNNEVIASQTPESSNVYFHTFEDDKDYSQRILYQFSDTGVYISKGMAMNYLNALYNSDTYTFYNDEEFKQLEGLKIRIDLSIPVY